MASIRDTINNNSAVVTVGAVLLLIVGLLLLMNQCSEGGPGQVNKYQYFYDLNTGELFVADALDIAPIEAPSGKPYKLPNGQEIPAGVRAFVYACGECGPDSKKIGYLEMYTPEAQKILQDARKQQEAAAKGESTNMDMGMVYEEGYTRGRLIAAPPEPGKPVQFFPTDGEGSEQGVAIMTALNEKCPKSQPGQAKNNPNRLRPCYPTENEAPDE